MPAVRFKSINKDSRLEMVLDIVLTNLYTKIVQALFNFN